MALRLIARDPLLRAESKLQVTPDRSALMRITEQDLDKSANYRVLNKIGQGAFGEVNSSKIREISCTSFSLRAICACTGLEGIAQTIRANTSAQAGFQQKPADWAVSKQPAGVSIVACTRSPQRRTTGGHVCAGDNYCCRLLACN